MHDCTNCGAGRYGMGPQQAQQAQNLQDASEALTTRILQFLLAALLFSFSRPMSYVWFCILGVGLTVVVSQLTGVASLDDPEVPESVFALIMTLGLAWSAPLAWYWRSQIPRVMPWILGAWLLIGLVSLFPASGMTQVSVVYLAYC